MSSKKKLLILLSVIVLLLVIKGVGEIVTYRFNDKEITKLNEELKSHVELSKYFTSIHASEDTLKDPLEYKDYKVYYLNILGSGNEEFSALSDNDKIEQMEEIAKIARKYYGDFSNFIDCGNNKFCDIEEVVIFESTKSGSDSYSIKFETSGSPDEMEITYYDENEKIQSRTVTKSRSVSTNTTPSVNNTTKEKILTLEETSCSRDGDYMYAKGYVKNNSDSFLSFIRIRADYINSSGSIVDTDYTYAVGSEGLAPNSRKSYEIMTRYNESVKECKYYIIDYQ